MAFLPGSYAQGGDVEILMLAPGQALRPKSCSKAQPRCLICEPSPVPSNECRDPCPRTELWRKWNCQRCRLAPRSNRGRRTQTIQVCRAGSHLQCVYVLATSKADLRGGARIGIEATPVRQCECSGTAARDSHPLEQPSKPHTVGTGEVTELRVGVGCIQAQQCEGPCARGDCHRQNSRRSYEVANAQVGAQTDRQRISSPGSSFEAWVCVGCDILEGQPITGILEVAGAVRRGVKVDAELRR